MSKRDKALDKFVTISQELSFSLFIISAATFFITMAIAVIAKTFFGMGC